MESEKKYWLDESGNVNRVCRMLYVVCALLILADLAYHKHVSISVENWFGFYGFYGFVACVVLVMGARGLRRILGRKEDYYG